MNFDLENTRRALIAKRDIGGADTPDGHTCSNVVEIIQALPGYVRPAWATDERQTLPWMLKQQMKRFRLRSVPASNGDRASG